MEIGMTRDRNFLNYWRALEQASAGSLPEAPTIVEAAMTFVAGEHPLAALEIIAAARVIEAAAGDELMAESSGRRTIRWQNRWN
jgi:hypothetical protein